MIDSPEGPGSHDPAQPGSDNAHDPFITQRLAAIVQSSDDAIISKDLNGIIKSWNRGAERIFGYQADEVIGRSIRLIIPADRQSEEDQVLARLRRGERVEHFETIRVSKSGTLIPISLSVAPVRDLYGNIVGASKIARDITERKRAEELAERSNRQATFLAQVSALAQSRDVERTLKSLASLTVPSIADWCAVDVLKPDGQIERLAVAHVNRDGEALGHRLPEQFDDPASPDSPASVIRTGTAIYLPSIAPAKGSLAPSERTETSGQTQGLASYICVPMIAHSRPFGAITMATVRSGRRYSEEDLRFAEEIASRTALAVENAQAYEQLDLASRVKDEFLATLSHELRTPLNAVVGYIRMLRAGTLNQERVPRALDVVERNATALTGIVEDVLDISRIVSGKVRLQVQSVDLRQLLIDAGESVAVAADAKGIRLDVKVPPKIGPIAGDPARLQQVVWNVLTNAVKFTPRDGQVQVRLEQGEAHVEIVVSDTGAGISAEFLPHVFERFRQAEGGTKRRHGGLGLGLAIARHIVEMHGGTVDAASEGEGKGTTIRIKLPMMLVHADTAAKADRAPREVRRPISQDIPALDGIQVLAVDDDQDALGLVREILESAGARVLTESSGVAALRTLGREKPDVLVADLGMPQMDGFDLIEQVRDSPDPALRTIPAAALTAYARSEDRAKALRSGFELHLPKPIDPFELVTAVARLSRRRGSGGRSV
jgi:PAS domain S-box-containing protein